MTETQAADQIPPGGEPLTDFTWQPWTPPEVASRLAGVDVPWAFAAGWALELFRGAGGRKHEDVEIAVPVASFAAIQRALEPYEFEIVGSDSKWAIADRLSLRRTRRGCATHPTASTCSTCSGSRTTAKSGYAAATHRSAAPIRR